MPILIVHIKNTDERERHHISCPKKELLVLEILEGNEYSGPEISRRSEDKISVANVYKLLKRLLDRGLVTKRAIEIPALDITVKRVVYVVSYDERDGKKNK